MTITISNQETMRYSKCFTAALLLLALSVGACHDSVVDLQPESELTEANFFETRDQIENAVLGVYSHYQDKLPQDYYLMEFPSDHLHISEYRLIEGLQPIGNLNFDPGNDRFTSFWQNSYNGIYRANSVLDNIDVPDDYLGNERAQFEGEAKFMRALYYFDLVRAFGGVPEITSRVSIDEARSTPRASEEEIYGLIISDLEDAIDMLPTPGEATVGRASVAAASALLGKVYVYQEQWNDALTHLNRVDDFGYELEDDFATLFTVDGSEDNSEFIFQMPYVENVDGHTLSTHFVPYSGAEGIVGSGDEVALPSWALHKKFEDEDSRKDVTINEEWQNPGSDEVEWYPFVGKYAVPHLFRTSGLDLPVIRYAEVLLLRAEALHRSGSDADALNELNRLRERAFGDDSHNYSSAGEGGTSLMDKIMLERQLELAYENERWFDLVRTGRFLEVMQVHEREYIPSSGTVTTSTYDVAEYKARFPIPQHEIDQADSGVLEQNPGY